MKVNQAALQIFNAKVDYLADANLFAINIATI
jgi:hypothetical protein